MSCCQFLSASGEYFKRPKRKTIQNIYKINMPPKKKGFEFWNESLNKARYIVAPMVEQSELPWRILSRRHGAELCYTPMLHASIFVKDARYRRENLTSCAEDRPLIVQFCANDPDIFLEAARLVEGKCEAVDLNLGCPQAIAKKGHYGAYLQDEWDLIYKMVNAVYNNLSIPVTCKIRIFENVNKSVQYAKMLEKAGCQLLAVHGRTREQKGPLTGVANWEHIKAIKQNVNIPVFANGNIQYTEDIEKCLKETGVDGIMIAEGSLHIPTLFEGKYPFVWDIAMEYLNLVEIYPCPTSHIRGHMFKLFHHCLCLTENKDLQEELAKAGTLEGFKNVTIKLKNRFNVDEENLDSSVLQFPIPAYICQPYVRPHSGGKKSHEMETPITQIIQDKKEANCLKRTLSGESLGNLSRRKIKKLLRNPKKLFGNKDKEQYSLCAKCRNPKGAKCSLNLCRACCRVTCTTEKINCDGHKFLFKSNIIHKNVRASADSLKETN